MPFSAIENLRPVTSTSQSCPIDGVAIRARAMTARGGKSVSRYLQINIGAMLAERLCLRGDRVRVAISVGDGNDQGKLGIAVNATEGGFVAKRAKSGNWAVTINQPSCEGLFSLDVPPHTRAGVKVVEAIRMPPMAVFEPDPALFAVED